MNNKSDIAIAASIRDTKQFRSELDDTLQKLKKATAMDLPLFGETSFEGARSSRERSLAIQKIQEGIMWLGMDLKAINESVPSTCPNPYPQSYNPASPVIEPTADGLKL